MNASETLRQYAPACQIGWAKLATLQVRRHCGTCTAPSNISEGGDELRRRNAGNRLIRNKTTGIALIDLSKFNSRAAYLATVKTSGRAPFRLILKKALTSAQHEPLIAAMTTLPQQFSTFRTLLQLPIARLRFDSRIEPANVLSTYRYYTRRHPRYKIIQNKSWGAALIDLRASGSRDSYFDSIKAKNCGGWHARRARARGYVLAEIDRNEHVDAIHAINTSEQERQGRSMDSKYCDKQERFDVLSNFWYFGVFDTAGKLVAYATLGRYGNFASFSQLIGYRNNDGIMHLMVTEIVARLIDEGQVDYLMYDTFFGALPGMQQFKTILGFRPFRARYSI